MSYFDKILKQSPWFLDLAKIDEDIHLIQLKQYKFIYKHEVFLNHTFSDGVYLLTGPRQIGKSTHIKMFIKQHICEETKEDFLYFNCDLLDRKQDIVDLIEEYLEKNNSHRRKYIMLDEITAIKDSFLAIKFLVDSGFSKNITYILTGSNTIKIKQTGEYLPGRRGKGRDFVIEPLTFKKYMELAHPNITINCGLDISENDFVKIEKLNLQSYFEQYLISGGFPRVINEHLANTVIANEIFTMYRAWIISEIAKSEKKEFMVKAILERILFSLGSEISYNSFAQDTGIGSHNTIYDYLDFLTNCSITSVIFNFDIQQKKINFRKNKKIYYNDPFIYALVDAWLSGKVIQDYAYLQNPMIAAQLVENAVFLQLKHQYPENVFFYAKEHEIDFVTPKQLIEIKYQNKIIANDYKFLLKQQSEHQKILITKNKFSINHELIILPASLFLMLEY